MKNQHSVNKNDKSPGEGEKLYFLWSENMTEQEFREILTGAKGEFLQHLYMGRLLREANLDDIWKYLNIEEIVSHWDGILPHLGKRRMSWDFLMQTWKRHGLV